MMIYSFYDSSKPEKKDFLSMIFGAKRVYIRFGPRATTSNHSKKERSTTKKNKKQNKTKKKKKKTKKKTKI